MSLHSFEVEEAVKHGIEPAILLANIRFWLQKNKANNANAFDGFYWTYNSARAFAELFPYMSKPSITRYLKTLCDNNVLKAENYNKVGYDRTIWYTIPNEFAINQNESRIRQNELRTIQNKPPIPDINPDITHISSLSETEKKCFEWAIREPFWQKKINGNVEMFMKFYSAGKLKAQFEQSQHNAKAETNGTNKQTGRRLSAVERVEKSCAEKYGFSEPAERVINPL